MKMRFFGTVQVFAAPDPSWPVERAVLWLASFHGPGLVRLRHLGGGAYAIKNGRRGVRARQCVVEVLP